MSGRRLRLIASGPGMTPAALADESSIEEAVLRREAHEHVAHLRLLALQLTVWPPETVRRHLEVAAAKYERKWADDPERVA